MKRRDFLAALPAAYWMLFSQGASALSKGEESLDDYARRNRDVFRTGNLPGDIWLQPRELWLNRVQSGERDKCLFWDGTKLVEDGYRRICHLLRDVRANQTVQFNIKTLNLLWVMGEYLHAYDYKRWHNATSGFRCEHTNNTTEGAARNSRHLYAEAVDGHRVDLSPASFANVASKFAAGGVGLYDRFVHVDAYRPRLWRG